MRRTTELALRARLPVGLAMAIGFATQVSAQQQPYNCFQQVGTDPQFGLHALNRAAYGPTPDELTQLTPNGSVATWLSQQLDPDSVPEDMNSPMNHLLPLLELGAHQGLPISRNDLIHEMIIRGIYSKRQLRERMTRFWDNHFTTHVGGVQQFFNNNHASAYSLKYRETQVFRADGLEDFENLLLTSALSPLMIKYLDSDKNKVGKPNENYAREVMELHTLGPSGPSGENYTSEDVADVAKIFTGWSIGKVPPALVGVPTTTEVDSSVLLELAEKGDVDQDGYIGPLDFELMQDLINAGGYNVRYDIWPKANPPSMPTPGDGFVNGRDLWYQMQNDGLWLWAWSFVFRPADHDYSVKTVFDQIPHIADFTTGGGPAGATNAWREGVMLLQHIAAQGQTGRFLSEKLYALLLDDLDATPPTTLLDAMEARYVASGGDIGAVIDELFTSAAYSAPAQRWGKFKTPFEYAISLARAIEADAPDQGSATLTLQPIRQLALWIQNELQFRMYLYPSPEGFPEAGGELQGTFQALKRNSLAQFSWETNPTQTTPWPDFDVDLLGLAVSHGVNRNVPGSVVNYFRRLLFQCNWMQEDQTNAIAQLTTDGTVDLSTLSDPAWEDQVRRFLGFLFSLPQFSQQ